MTLAEDLRPAIDAKAKALSEFGSFYFHDGPNVSRIIDAKPEQCQCFVQTRACEGSESESEFDLSRGAARIFEKFVVVPTGIEPVFPT